MRNETFENISKVVPVLYYRPLSTDSRSQEKSWPLLPHLAEPPGCLSIILYYNPIKWPPSLHVFRSCKKYVYILDVYYFFLKILSTQNNTKKNTRANFFIANWKLPCNSEVYVILGIVTIIRNIIKVYVILCIVYPVVLHMNLCMKLFFTF